MDIQERISGMLRNKMKNLNINLSVDLVPIEAGLIDIYNTNLKIHRNILKKIKNLKQNDAGRIVDYFFDLKCALEHINNHSQEAIKTLENSIDNLETTYSTGSDPEN